tara:strand:- start:203 stop:1690 length:1488 start_codon:yes stop_codon:yes gene_type:complete
MNFIGIIGIFVLLGLAWLMSYDKKNIPFRIIFWGIGLQILFAVIILRTDYWSFIGMGILCCLIMAYQFSQIENGKKALKDFLTPILIGMLLTEIMIYCIYYSYTGGAIMKDFSGHIANFLSLSDYGAKFLFGNLADNQLFFPDHDTWPGFGFQFAFKVLPTIIFFGGMMSILYYLGIIQKIINSLSKFMRWTIGTSGAETLSCSANVFVGQTEAPLLIKPFLNKMTKSELTTIMVGGFATIAGGVLAGVSAMGIDVGYLVAASVMSAPAALVVGKIIFPEKEQSETSGETDELPNIEVGSNVVEAASNGIIDGLKLAVNVGAMLIGFIAIIAVLDSLLNWLDSIIDGSLVQGAYVQYSSSGFSSVSGEFLGYFPGSLQTLFGNLLKPLTFIMGVPPSDIEQLGNLFGMKLSLNEFVAYGQLGSYVQEGLLTHKGEIIATYALCGFANFSSIGIQIGGISAIAPKRKADLSRIAVKAMFGGAIASWITATIAGLLI